MLLKNRSRNILRFPWAAGEPPDASHSGVSPRPSLPLDKEDFDSIASHAENRF